MADTSPTWGNWVTHVDSVGQAPTMSTGFNQPANTTGTILFDRMVIALTDTSDYNLAGGIALAGHFPLELPNEFPLAGILLIRQDMEGEGIDFAIGRIAVHGNHVVAGMVTAVGHVRK